MDTSFNVPKIDKPRIVIIGGGFAGLEFAKALPDKDFQLVMIDKNNYHTFQPLLYQVATAGLEPDSIASPLRQLFEKRKDFYFRWANVEKIVSETKTLITSIGDLTYDVLVLALGSKTNFYGNQELMQNAFELKQIPHALDLRSQILQNFERATITSDPIEQDSLMDYVIVGGGPTGVELAGALAELKKHILPNDFPELDFSKMNVHLLEGGNELLSAMSVSSRNRALKYLLKMGVEIKFGARVQSFDGKTVSLGDGTVINASTVVWAAGVTGSLVAGLKEEAIFKGRIKTDVYNKVVGHEDIFAVGDVAAMVTEETPNGFGMLAPVAMQQGKLLAQNLVRQRKNEVFKPFKYFDKGTMATVGRNKAVVDLPPPLQKIHFGGIMAWLAWMFVHILYIASFRNRIITFVNWVWSYFTYDKGTRLIIRPFKRSNSEIVQKT
ncbi:MAG: NAD(P)/FAD-dependent oxidoreductase [Verrucomicrobia bacterium]|nr:NAD(P)/FAD-dependent oxidoreductase [Cytophagales bacterium]